jgi:hypothetical protein
MIFIRTVIVFFFINNCFTCSTIWINEIYWIFLRWYFYISHQYMPSTNTRIIHSRTSQSDLQIQEVVNPAGLPFYPIFFANGPGYLLSKNQRTLLKTINEPKIRIPDLL